MKKLIAFFALFLIIPSVNAQTWVTNPVNGHMYAELTTWQSWDMAEEQAQFLGGHLVTLNDTTENEWVRTTFGLHGGISMFAWIGLSEIFPYDRHWSWSSGEPFGFANWGSGEPSSYMEHWVAMDGDGWWRDLTTPWSPPIRHTAIMERIPSQAVPEPSPFVVFLLSILSCWGATYFTTIRRRGG